MVLRSKMDIQKLETKIPKKTITDMELDVENAYRITEKLAFPRLIGSEGEKKAIKVILEELKAGGFEQIYREKFYTSFYNWILLRYMFMPLGIILIFLAISFFINPLLTIGLFIVNVIMGIKALGFASSCEIKLSKHPERNYETENIYTELKSKNPKVKIVFIAHWDSKSQSFPARIRILIFLIALFGLILISFTYLVLSFIQLFIPFNNALLNIILFSISVSITIISNLNYFNKTGNISPGAFDNAAAVGAVIELSRYYKENPKDNIDFLFLYTSSEELNLGGIKHFIQKHKDEFDGDSTYFINLDAIGGNELIRLITSYGVPRKTSSERLNKLFLESAKELKYPLKDIYAATGVWSDYMPIVQEGFKACWLASQPGLKYVHTKKDDMTLVSKEGIQKILLLCESVVNKLNNNYNS